MKRSYYLTRKALYVWYISGKVTQRMHLVRADEC